MALYKDDPKKKMKMNGIVSAITKGIDAVNVRKETGMFNYGNIYTGPDSTNPGVLKAQENKAKGEANLKLYKKKIKK
jgi:hypothetical protein